MSAICITLVSDPAIYSLQEEDINTCLMYLKSHDIAMDSSSCTWLSAAESCTITISSKPSAINSIEAIITLLSHYIADKPIDLCVMPAEKRKKKLLICDMDSTIIEQECIDEMADQLGIKVQIAEITEQAMRGEIEFQEALENRVALLAGLNASVLEQVYQNQITLSPGAKTLVSTMKYYGAYCMLVSGGFTFFTQRVAEKVGFHEQQANKLEIENNILTGKVYHPILDKDAKRKTIYKAIRQKGLSVEDVVALGDGANDIPMLSTAGLGIAYHAKPAVQEEVSVAINHTTLESALFFQGYSRQEFVL